MGRFQPRDGLDELIAQRFGRPKMQQVLDMLTDEAKLRAPECRVWITMRDERVRASHIETDSQVVPDNLRFKVPKVDTGNDINDIRVGYDLARHPRDPELPIGNRINCRCSDPPLPQPLKDSIHATDVHVEGARVSGTIETRFPRAAESEFGTDKDHAAHYMTGALRDVAARLRAGQTR